MSAEAPPHDALAIPPTVVYGSYLGTMGYIMRLATHPSFEIQPNELPLYIIPLLSGAPARPAVKPAPKQTASAATGSAASTSEAGSGAKSGNGDHGPPQVSRVDILYACHMPRSLCNDSRHMFAID